MVTAEKGPLERLGPCALHNLHNPLLPWEEGKFLPKSYRNFLKNNATSLNLSFNSSLPIIIVNRVKAKMPLSTWELSATIVAIPNKMLRRYTSVLTINHLIFRCVSKILPPAEGASRPPRCEMTPLMSQCPCGNQGAFSFSDMSKSKEKEVEVGGFTNITEL
jgi:hypothetical protein